MDPIDKRRLIYNKTKLLEQVKVAAIIPQLLEKQILSYDDMQHIERARTDHDQVDELLEVLELRGPNAYPVFREVLQQDYDWLVKDLDQTPKSALCDAGDTNTLGKKLQGLTVHGPITQTVSGVGNICQGIVNTGSYSESLTVFNCDDQPSMTFRRQPIQDFQFTSPTQPGAAKELMIEQRSKEV